MCIQSERERIETLKAIIPSWGTTLRQSTVWMKLGNSWHTEGTKVSRSRLEVTVQDCWEQNKRRGPRSPGEEWKEKYAHTPSEFPYSLVSQAWEGCNLPYPLIPGWAFLYPTHQGVVKGQPCLETPAPGATWLKPPGLWETGKREEVPNIDQSALWNLKEQSRDSMV